jgi:hypothetical protein
VDISFNTKDKHPTYGYLYIIGGATVAKVIIPRSIREAEYYALSEAAPKAAGIRNFIAEF